MTPLEEVRAFLPEASYVQHIPEFDEAVNFETDSFVKARYAPNAVVYFRHGPRKYCQQGAWRCLVCIKDRQVLFGSRKHTAWEAFKDARGELSRYSRAMRTLSEQLGTVPRPRKKVVT